RDQERREARRGVALGEKQHRVRAREERADQRARGELPGRHPHRAAAPGDDRGHDRAGGEEAGRDADERRDRLDGERDEEVRRAPDDVDRPEGGPHLRPPAHRASESAAPAPSSTIPTARGQEIAICSTPKRPKRSITAPITSCPAIRIPIVAVAPIRGCANVIVNTTTSPISPPSHIHAGVRNASERPPVPARTASRIASESTSWTAVANASASTMPIRSPKRPMTATCTDPASPAKTVSATAAAVTRRPTRRSRRG